MTDKPAVITAGLTDEQLEGNLREAYMDRVPYLVITSRRQNVGIAKCERGVELGLLRFVEHKIDSQETHWRYYWTDAAKAKWGPNK